MDRLGDLGGPLPVQDGSIVFVRLPCVHTCLGTPGRFFRFRGQTGCRQRYVGRAEDDPLLHSSILPGADIRERSCSRLLARSSLLLRLGSPVASARAAAVISESIGIPSHL